MSLPPGFTARVPRTTDAARVAELLRATEEQDFGESEAAADELAADWQTFDLVIDAVLVEHGDAIVGYGYFFRRGAEQAIIDVYVPPVHAGRGIGSWLVGELERRADAVARIGSGIARAILLEAFGEFHRRGEHTVVLNVDSESLTGATRLYESVGMQMTREIDAFERTLA